MISDYASLLCGNAQIFNQPLVSLRLSIVGSGLFGALGEGGQCPQPQLVGYMKLAHHCDDGMFWLLPNVLHVRTKLPPLKLLPSWVLGIS